MGFNHPTSILSPLSMTSDRSFEDAVQSVALIYTFNLILISKQGGLHESDYI